MKLPWPLHWINWRLLFAALMGVGILHIIATLAAPSLAVATAYDRLKGLLPENRMMILPAVAPGAQPLPFMTPALRYAMCRFDTASVPVEVTADLGGDGSSLTIYSEDGEAIYTAAQADVATHRVRIVPDDGRFMGLTPEARGQPSERIPSATLHARRGIVVYAVAERGMAYRGETAGLLANAACQATAR